MNQDPPEEIVTLDIREETRPSELDKKISAALKGLKTNQLLLVLTCLENTPMLALWSFAGKMRERLQVGQRTRELLIVPKIFEERDPLRLLKEAGSRAFTEGIIARSQRETTDKSDTAI